jgi:APA family basic amino acid/polyamine antiporter
VVGVRESGWLTAMFTLIEVGGLVVLVVLGIDRPGAGEALNTAPSPGVLGGAAVAFFAYLGFEQVAGLAEEAREPGKQVPRAILLGLAITVVLYALVALAAVGLLPAEQLAASDKPLTQAAAQVSPRLAGGLGGVALFATANTCLISIMLAARLLLGMAREGHLPRALASVLPGRKTPWLATLVAGGGAAALLLAAGRVGALATAASWSSLLVFAFINLVLLVLRRENPRQERPFRAPVAVAVTGTLASLGLLGFSLYWELWR